ncbi:MAG: DUF488 domain-containing protein [Peptococcaceae bacterium]|nr:DUF488 domain-containing protein [Peptococcaceae bacterium]
MSRKSYQPKFRRQRFLLAFLRQLNDGVTATDLQKLVFLYTMTEGSDFYEFVPYRFGPYSFQLREDLDILQREGFVTLEYIQDSTRIKANVDFPIETTSFRIAPERGNTLIRRAYREYPYYAINSEITKKLFCGEDLEWFKNIKKKYAKTDQVLFTIGYEGKSIEGFLNTLIQNDVRLLCDVRKNPLSRKFGFSKRKLEHITQTVGIKYVHLPELGIDSNKRSSLETLDDFQCLFEDYAKTLPNRRVFLEKINTLLCINDRIALMCFEHEPEMCHRHVIRDYIAKTYRVRSQDL